MSLTGTGIPGRSDPAASEPAVARRSRLVPLVLGPGVGAIVLAGLVALLENGEPRTSRPALVPRAEPAPSPPESPPVSRVPSRSAEELLELGLEKGRASDWEGAIDLLTRAIELDPELANAWCERGAARANKGDWNGAISDETKAIELDP